MSEDHEEKQLLVRHSGETKATAAALNTEPTAKPFRSPNGMTTVSQIPDSPTDTAVSFAATTQMEQASTSSIQRLRFEELLRRAEDEDLTWFEKTHCIYEAGRDQEGRPVIAFIGKWFPYEAADLDKALLYLIKVLHPIVTNGPYVVVYFHTKTNRGNIPHYWWIKHVYTSLGYEYKKNLKAFYVVHPTMWTRMTCWWFSTFMAPVIKHKIFNIYALQELSGVGITEEDSDLDLPMFIAEHDMSLHGVRIFNP